MVYIVMLAYNKVDVVKNAIDRLMNVVRFYPEQKYNFLLVDPEYPLNSDKKAIYKLWASVRSQFEDTSYLRIENKGVAGNYNQVIELMKFRNDDIVHFFDPDNAPRTCEYLEKMIHVLSCPSVAYATLERPDPDIPYGPLINIDGVECYQITRGHSWPMGGFQASFLKEAYPLAQDNGHWGFIEDWLFREFTRQGKIGVFLKGHIDGMIDGAGQDGGGQDAAYMQYQIDCANRLTQDSFETWLDKKLN